MILDETKLAATVLDGEEEETTPSTEGETPAAILDGEGEGEEAPSTDQPAAMLDGEGENQEEETPAPDQTPGA